MNIKDKKPVPAPGTVVEILGKEYRVKNVEDPSLDKCTTCDIDSNIGCSEELPYFCGDNKQEVVFVETNTLEDVIADVMEAEGNMVRVTDIRFTEDSPPVVVERRAAFVYTEISSMVEERGLVHITLKNGTELHVKEPLDDIIDKISSHYKQE